MIVGLNGFESVVVSAEDQNGRFARRVAGLSSRVNDARLDVQFEIDVNEEQSATAKHEIIGY